MGGGQCPHVVSATVEVCCLPLVISVMMTSHNSTAGLHVVLQRKYERHHLGFKSFGHYLAMSDLNRLITIWLCRI